MNEHEQLVNSLQQAIIHGDEKEAACAALNIVGSVLGLLDTLNVNLDRIATALEKSTTGEKSLSVRVDSR